MERKHQRILPEEVTDGSDFYDFSDEEEEYYNYPYVEHAYHGSSLPKKRCFQEAFQVTSRQSPAVRNLVGSIYELINTS